MTGRASPVADWESVFEPFVRIDRRRPTRLRDRAFRGRRLMEAMGGRVWLEANGFGGSRFMLALPVASADAREVGGRRDRLVIEPATAHPADFSSWTTSRPWSARYPRSSERPGHQVITA
jgi:hypothetical protein